MSLPRTIDLAGGTGLRGFPALVDEGESVGIRICESSGEQAATMARGTRRLLRLTVPSPTPLGDRPARPAADPCAHRRAPRHAGSSDRGCDERSARRAGRQWRRAGVGRRGVRGAPRARSRRPPAHDARGAGRVRSDPGGGAGRPRAARRASGERRLRARATGRRPPAGPARVPRDARGGRASRGWAMSSATCAPRRAASNGWRAMSPPTARGWQRSTSWRLRPPGAVT